MKRTKVEHPIFGHIGKKIKFIRILQGIKQRDLAERMGVSQQAISSLEKAGMMDAHMIGQFAEAMGVTTGFILNSGDLAMNYFRTPVEPVKAPEPKVDSSLDKVVELYERLLEMEKEKVAYLENLLDKYSLKEVTRPYRKLQMVKAI